MSTDRCSFCDRSDVPLVRAKHAATCLDCARLAVEILSPPRPATRGFSVVCDCDGVMCQCSLGTADEPCGCPCHGAEVLP